MGQFSKPLQAKTLRWLFVGLFLLIITILTQSIWEIASTTSFGENDFVGYWSATYLFHNGQNPYDPGLMEITQDTQLETSQDSTIMAWNPPLLFVFLLPLSWLTFLQAKFVWLIINLIIIIATSLMLVEIYNPTRSVKFTLITLLFTLLFPPVISGLYMGQVTILVTFGLVASMALIKKNHWFWAGAILILTTIKPHLVVLQVIYLLIYLIQERKPQGWAGILFAGIAFLVVLFVLRPQLASDLVGLSKIAPTKWFTPTIGGWISFIGVTEIARYLIVLFLPIPFILAKYHTKLSMEFSIALLTLITVPFTFFGWSYDQAILLIPIAQIFHWLYQSRATILKYVISILIILGIGINYYQKVTGTYEVYYVWVPLFWCLIFGVTRIYSTRSTYAHEQTTT